MADPFLGEIRLFSGNMIGDQYGGNGRTFNLPDLRSRVLVHAGGPNGYKIGDSGGAEFVTLLATQLPRHTHAINVDAAAADAAVPAVEGMLAEIAGPVDATTPAPKVYIPAEDAGTTVALSESKPMVGPLNTVAQPHENRQAYIAMNYYIAVQGIFPTRG